MDGTGLSSGIRGDDSTGLASVRHIRARRLRGEGMEGMGLSLGTSERAALGIGELNALSGLGLDATGEFIELGLVSHSRGQVRIQSMAWRMLRTDSLNFPRSPKAIWIMSNIFSLSDVLKHSQFSTSKSRKD